LVARGFLYQFDVSELAPRRAFRFSPARTALHVRLRSHMQVSTHFFVKFRFARFSPPEANPH